jgi:DNA-binding IclR family transcriptional regulator
MKTSKKARPIKSDETLIQIIDVVMDTGEATITEIAEEVGKTKSTVYFHLSTLEQYGYVVKSENGYRLGLKFLDVGILARESQPLYPAVKPKVKELAKQTEEKSWCMVEEHGELIYLYGAEGEHPVRTHARIGLRKPIHSLASGKAILAHVEEDRLEKILNHHGLPKMTENTTSDREEFYKELEAVRERGMAFNLEESTIGMRAVAAPIKKENGGVHGAISVSGPAKRLPRELLENDLGQLVQGAANELEINLRYD